MAAQPDRSASPFHGWLALVTLTLRRHWRVRSLGWVTLGLLALMAVAVGVISKGPGWRIETRRASVYDPRNPEEALRLTHAEYALDRLPLYQGLPGPPGQFEATAIAVGAYQRLILSPDPEATKYREDFAFLNFSRWVVFGMFHSFLLPLFTLAYASGSLGSERENRTLIWLTTRPQPRWAIYLAKFFGVLPWCVAVGLSGFAVLCLAGGDLGRRTFLVYWPCVIAGSIGLAALFHLIGAVVRRPAVVGLVYIFFFETLVANLPGSLKRLSLNYYTRSLMYNEASATAGTVTPEILDVYQPLGSLSAWLVLLTAAVVLTAIGAILFARQEPKDDM